MGSMDIDQSNGDEPPRLLLRPVKPFESGVGLPYAPENWPNPGDTWYWKVGPRVNGNGHFVDRYLYPPKYLPGLDMLILRKHKVFRSRLSLERYIRVTFPEADVRKFFASFIWRIPCENGAMPEKQVQCPECNSDDDTMDGDESDTVYNSAEDTMHGDGSDTVYNSAEDTMHGDGSDTGVCKAGNDKCGSLMPQSDAETLSTMPCDLCCGERNFCSDCCCILCCKLISLEHEGYSYIKCEAVVSEGRICGHVAHVNCALRAYMAGTIGGRIKLDAEYYCRRCDARKDLVPYVNKFLEICQRVDHQGDVEKILNLGICILRGSQRDNAKELLNCIKSTIIKIRGGTSLEDFSNDDTAMISSDFSDNDTSQSLQDVTPIQPIPFNHEAEMHKLDEEIIDALKSLRISQDLEYEIAEARLNAQKECLSELYRQLEKEKAELSRRVTGTDVNSLMMNVSKRSDQIRKEVMKFKEMKEVAKGFGRTSRGVLEEYFHLSIED